MQVVLLLTRDPDTPDRIGHSFLFRASNIEDISRALPELFHHRERDIFIDRHVHQISASGVTCSSAKFAAYSNAA